MRMKNAKRMLRRRDVVAQDEIKLIIPVSASGDRRYGIVRLSVGLRENECVGVGIEPPCTEDFIRKCDEALFVFSVYPTTQALISSNPAKVISNSDGAFSMANV